MSPKGHEIGDQIKLAETLCQQLPFVYGRLSEARQRLLSPSMFFMLLTCSLIQEQMLARAGVADGDIVWIGEFSFEYQADV